MTCDCEKCELCRCLDDVKTLSAENAVIFDKISQARSERCEQCISITALKCIELIQDICLTRSAVVAKIKREFL